jgi:hypothetical protein
LWVWAEGPDPHERMGYTPNKQVQAKYWKLFKESDWNKHRIPSTTEGIGFIIECILLENPDFSNLGTLTNQIEKGTLRFIKDVESFLSK